MTAGTAFPQVNVFAESSVATAAARSFSLPLPLHAAWPEALRRDGLFELVAALLPRLRAPPPSCFVSEEILAARFAPLADAEAEPAAPPPPPRRRRRRAPPPPPRGDLSAALLAHAAECAAALDDLHPAIQDAARADAARWGEPPAAAPSEVRVDFVGVRDLALAHLLELWALRLFGPAALAAELELLGRRLRESG